MSTSAHTFRDSVHSTYPLCIKGGYRYMVCHDVSLILYGMVCTKVLTTLYHLIISGFMGHDVLMMV
jgi:hypothetical protein